MIMSRIKFLPFELQKPKTAKIWKTKSPARASISPGVPPLLNMHSFSWTKKRMKIRGETKELDAGVSP